MLRVHPSTLRVARPERNPLDVLQRLGGWSDLRMVMNYAHHAPGYLAQYANNVRKAT